MNIFIYINTYNICNIYRESNINDQPVIQKKVVILVDSDSVPISISEKGVITM